MDQLVKNDVTIDHNPRSEVRHGGDLQVDDFVAAAVQAALCAAPDSRRQRPNATGAAAPIMAQGSLGDSPSLESLPIMA